MDNELQDLVPHLLKDILALIWEEKMDWFFGIDMRIYYDLEKPPIVPDGFLSIGYISLTTEQQIKALTFQQLDNLGLALFGFSNLDDLNQWLNLHKN